MVGRPAAVAFDMLGTVLSLDGLRPRIEAAGAPGQVLELWIAETLRDGFGLDAAGVWRPFRQVAEGALRRRLALAGASAAPEAVERVLAGFAELDPHPDARPALERLRDAGVRAAALTNGSVATTEAALRHAGLEGLVERVMGIEEVERWKPRREVYLHAAATLGCSPGQLALVAAHGWDVQGARRAGLRAGYVARGGAPYPAAMEPPEVKGGSLVEVVERLLTG